MKIQLPGLFRDVTLCVEDRENIIYLENRNRRRINFAYITNLSMVTRNNGTYLEIFPSNYFKSQ